MRSFFFLFVLLCFGKCSLLAQESRNQRPGEGMITVKEYAAFLQAIASASQERGGSLVSMEAIPINDLYEEKMVINGRGASLLRSGAVGNERYEVVGEEVEVPISFLNWRDAACYCVWKNNTGPTITGNVLRSDERTEDVDVFLKSNLLTFWIVDAEGAIHQASLPGATASESMSAILEDMAAISLGLTGSEALRPTETVRASNELFASSDTFEISSRIISEATDEVRVGGKKREARMMRTIQELDNKLAAQRASFIQKNHGALELTPHPANLPAFIVERKGIFDLTPTLARDEKEDDLWGQAKSDPWYEETNDLWNRREGNPFAKIAEIETQVRELRLLSLESKAKSETTSGDEKHFWMISTKYFNEAADYLENIIAIDPLEQLEIAMLWREASVQIQEGAKQMRGVAKAAGRKNAEEIARLLCMVSDPVSQAQHAVYSAKAKQAQAAGKLDLAQKWREVDQESQLAFQCFAKRKAADIAGKKEESTCWQNVGRAIYWVADTQGKAIEAEESGRSKIAEAWRRAADFQRQSKEAYVKSVHAYTRGKEEEGINWRRAGRNFYSAASAQGQSITEEERGPQGMMAAHGWRLKATSEQHMAEFFVKAATACAARETEEGHHWQERAHLFFQAAEKLEQAVETKQPRNPRVDIILKKMTPVLLQLGEHDTKAMNAYAQGKREEGKKWQQMVNAFYKVTETIGKALDAAEAGQDAVAATWMNTALQEEQSISFPKESHSANVKEDDGADAKEESEGLRYLRQTVNNFLRQTVNNSESVTRKLEKAIRAEEAGKSAIAKKWLEAAQTQKQAEECLELARTSPETEPEQHRTYRKISDVRHRTAEGLEKAIEAEEAGKQAIAQTWREAVAMLQQASKNYEFSLSLRMRGKMERYQQEQHIGDALFGVAEKLKKKIEAEEANKPAIAEMWREAAALQQASAEIYTKWNRGDIIIKRAKALRWFYASDSFSKAAEKLGKAIEATEAEQPAIAQAWRTAAEKYKQAHVCWKRTAEAIEAKKWFTGENGARAATVAAEEASEAAERLANTQR